MSDKKSILFYCLGWLLYLPIVTLNYYAGGGWLNVNEIYFIPAIVFSLASFFYSIILMNPLPKFQTIALNVGITIAMITAIPNITFEVGTTGYHPVSASFGNLSFTMMLINALHYFSRIFIRTKANKSGNQPKPS